MKKLLYLLIFVNSLLFGVDSSSLSVTANKVYTSKDGFNISQECTPICRGTNAPYKTKVVDFNPFTGVTKCIIVNGENDESNEFSFVGDTLNQQCINDTSKKVDVSTLASYNKSLNSNVTLNYQEKGSLSKIFGAIATLDDDIINISGTVNSNNIQLKNGDIDYANNRTFNSLSSANLGFFVNLFYGFQKVYQYVQYFLFIFVGAFFLTLFIWNMSVDKISQTGEKEKINKLIVPLVMVLLCFVPVIKENGITTTPIQNIIQYFIQQSNTLADRMSIVGSESYLKKLCGTAGASNTNGELYLAERVQNLENGIKAYTKAYKECQVRFESYYTDYNSFQTKNEELIKKAEEMNPDGNKDFSFAGCRKIEADLISSERELIEKRANLTAIKSSINNNELQNLLGQLQVEMETKSNSYGWYYSAFLTSISVVVENLGEISNSSVQNEVKERNIDLDKKYNIQSSNEYIGGYEDGGFFGTLAYFVLPGAGDIYNAIDKSEKATSIKNNVATIMGKGLGGLPFVGDLFKSGTEMIAQVVESAAIMAMIQTIYSNILKYLPLMIGIVGGFIAIGSYIIELIKYFYVAPFMVLYAITQKRQDKIIDFFVDGIAIFLKPILITICIFLSIFVYYLFTELFMGLVMLNFEFLGNIGVQSFNFVNGLTLSIFTTLFFIIVSIATSFIMYQIVVNGSKVFLSIAGLQDKESLSNSISQRVDKHTFQV